MAKRKAMRKAITSRIELAAQELSQVVQEWLRKRLEGIQVVARTLHGKCIELLYKGSLSKELRDAIVSFMRSKLEQIKQNLGWVDFRIVRFPKIREPNTFLCHIEPRW